MNRKIDNLGRVCIPKEMRSELDINDYDEVNIELHGNKIIISNPNGMRSKEEIEKMLSDTKRLPQSEYTQGFVDALTMVLNREGK